MAEGWGQGEERTHLYFLQTSGKRATLPPGRGSFLGAALQNGQCEPATPSSQAAGRGSPPPHPKSRKCAGLEGNREGLTFPLLLKERFMQRRFHVVHSGSPGLRWGRGCRIAH